MPDLKIKGLQKTSMVDYPPYIAATVFLAGCNFRCGYCYNREIVFDEGDSFVSEKEFFQFLDKRKKWLDAVCITGGEPTLHTGLLKFMKKIKEKGILVKLDTNGTKPDVLREVIEEKVVDYIAMDIKAQLNKYNEITNSKVDTKNIKKSVGIIRNSGINYEFRTTVVAGVVAKEDLLEIGEWLKGSRKYCIQQFVKAETMLDESFKTKEQYTDDELKEFKKILEPYFDEVELRGI